METKWVQVIAHRFPRVVEKLLPWSFRLGGPWGRGLRWCCEECGPWHSTDTYQAHLASPSIPHRFAPVMLNNPSNPHDHSMESGSWPGRTDAFLWLRRERMVVDKLLSRTLKKEWKPAVNESPSPGWLLIGNWSVM